MKDAILVQRPLATSTSPTELLLLFHGVGSSAEDLVPLGKAMASLRPNAGVVVVGPPGGSSRSPVALRNFHGWGLRGPRCTFCMANETL